MKSLVFVFMLCTVAYITAETTQTTKASTAAAEAKATTKPAATKLPSTKASMKVSESPNEPATKNKTIGKVQLSCRMKGMECTLKRKNSLVKLKIFELEEKWKNRTKNLKKQFKDINFKKTAEKNDDKGSRYGVSAYHLGVEGTMKDGGTIKIELHVFLKNGTITGDDGNEYPVMQGSLKFNIYIDMPKLAEEGVDFKLGVKCKKMKGKMSKARNQKAKKGKNSKSKNRNPETFNVCADARIVFSSTYQKDGVWVDMPENYPIPEDAINGYSIIKLHFSGKKIVYDPVMDVGDDIENEINEENETSAASNIFFSWVTLVLIFVLNLAKYI